MKQKKQIMETWIVYAVLSMIFAGVTTIFAKYGLEKVQPNMALLIRTSVIFFLVVLVAFKSETMAGIRALSIREILLLTASGITAYLSWYYYFRAIKDGPVSYVAVIDKGSIVITLLLSFLLLKEPAKPQVLIGGGLVLTGVLILIWK